MTQPLIANSPILGVDVGGTKILVGLVGADGSVIASQRYPMNRETTASTLDSIDAAIIQFFQSHPSCPSLTAAGFGLVGRCDPQDGIWVHADNLPIPQPIPLATSWSTRLGVPVFLDNDVFCAATAELYFGAGRQHRNFVLINVGTGLSAGIIADGRLIRGAGNVAGEIGRTSLGIFDRRGRTLEECCSGGGILDIAGRKHYPDTRTVFAAAALGDPTAETVVNNAITTISEAAADLVTIFNPSALVLAGSVAVNDRVWKAIEANIRKNAYKSSLIDLLEVTPSKLSEGTVGLIGAAQSARVRLGIATQ